MKSDPNFRNGGDVDQCQNAASYLAVSKHRPRCTSPLAMMVTLLHIFENRSADDAIAQYQVFFSARGGVNEPRKRPNACGSEMSVGLRNQTDSHLPSFPLLEVIRIFDWLRCDASSRFVINNSTYAHRQINYP